MPDVVADFVANSEADNLNRLYLALDMRIPLPDDLADWLLHTVLRELRYRARNAAIAQVLTSLPGRSTWNRCGRFLAIARANDVELARIRAVGLPIPSSVAQIYRIVRTAP
jgi:hypothetical protein